MKTQTNLKIETSQKEFFLQAAHQAKEDFTEFMVNSAMLRIQRQMLMEKPVPAMAVMGKVYLEGYSPSQVSDAEAKEIDALLAKARKGKLAFRKLGQVALAPPRRAKAARD